MGRDMRRTGRQKGNGVLIRFAVAAAAVCAVIILLYTLGKRYEENKYEQERGVMSEGFGLLPTVSYQDADYTLRTDVTSVLLIGSDRGEEKQALDFRKGGQADFLLLVAIDHKNKTIRQLQIDRDTMTDVTTLGVFGNETGTRRMQVSLAHGFGTSEADSCRYTVKAVQKLLCDARIGFYIALDMRDIGTLNNVLGGVSVTLDEDLTVIDPLMQKGATLLLTDDQAHALVRARMSVGDGTNKSRIRRQRIYVDAAIQTLRAGMAGNTEYAAQLLDRLSGAITTDMLRTRLINEVNQSSGYQLLPADELKGISQVGSDGFSEFHADESSIMEWITQTLYKRR